MVYSPEGVIADDVIRHEVRRLPTSRHVVVVTNDAEIVRDVRAAGANVVPSNALLAVLWFSWKAATAAPIFRFESPAAGQPSVPEIRL